MTAAASERLVTVSAAEVTIRVVHVAERPMTIAVYEQMPDLWYRMAEQLVGRIERCRKRCPLRPWVKEHPDGRKEHIDHGRHFHLLGICEGEPGIVAYDLYGGWCHEDERVWELPRDERDAIITERNAKGQEFFDRTMELPQLYIAR